MRGREDVLCGGRAEIYHYSNTPQYEQRPTEPYCCTHNNHSSLDVSVFSERKGNTTASLEERELTVSCGNPEIPAA
ncbi:unnamed protein product [Chondrus crispus]|uniref:Uncharacterized protein n=1 Tax=Chondrus crispus TaxID=2769 RepID=R7QDS0_CHOCR|nr:unnamed protein product [Chondrus crispus]CDF35565.1 unnamed protein product [Chondrus crispus]|eukprot:XP_005715384.1 unnamed protein product [Chondrus crispus]